MPLYDPDRAVDLDPRDAVHAVHTFLEGCRRWAEEVEIPKRLERVREGKSPEEAAKLHAWVAYLRFTEHARQELVEGKLDHWFGGEKGAAPG